MELTREMIKSEIQAYQERLDRVKDRLRELAPSSRYESSKIRAKRNQLRAEVRHIEGLMQMATEALEEAGQAEQGALVAENKR